MIFHCRHVPNQKQNRWRLLRNYDHYSLFVTGLPPFTLCQSGHNLHRNSHWWTLTIDCSWLDFAFILKAWSRSLLYVILMLIDIYHELITFWWWIWSAAITDTVAYFLREEKCIWYLSGFLQLSCKIPSQDSRSYRRDSPHLTLNHGFQIIRLSLPKEIAETHLSWDLCVNPSQDCWQWDLYQRPCAFKDWNKHHHQPQWWAMRTVHSLLSV